MKILFFSAIFGSPTTTFIRRETEYFNTIFPTKFLCIKTYPKVIIPDYVEVIPFKGNKVREKINWWLWQGDWFCSFKNKIYAKKINKFITEFNPDIIHCHFGYEALMLLDNIDKFEKKKFIVHFHGYDATAMTRKKSYVQKLKKYLSKPNVFTISCNAFFIQKLSKELAIPISNPFVLKYGIDTKKLFFPADENKLNEEIILLQVSSLVEKKGHIYTIQTFKKLIADRDFENVKLYFTGEGSEKIKLLALVKELGLENKVVFLGTLQPNQVVEYLSKATIFVHHSITSSSGDMEGIPNSIMEAMAMKLPVVSTIHSGIPELIEDGVNGYLVKEKDIENYVLRIKDALKMGKLNQNREKILSEYSVEKHNALLTEIYEKCIKA